MNVPIAKRADENGNFSVANDPNHPNEMACCKKDGPEWHFSVANDLDNLLGPNFFQRSVSTYAKLI